MTLQPINKYRCLSAWGNTKTWGLWTAYSVNLSKYWHRFLLGHIILKWQSNKYISRWHTVVPKARNYVTSHVCTLIYRRGEARIACNKTAVNVLISRYASQNRLWWRGSRIVNGEKCRHKTIRYVNLRWRPWGHSLRSISYKSMASSKASSPQRAISWFLFQFPVHYRFRKVIQ